MLCWDKRPSRSMQRRTERAIMHNEPRRLLTMYSEPSVCTEPRRIKRERQSGKQKVLLTGLGRAKPAKSAIICQEVVSSCQKADNANNPVTLQLTTGSARNSPIKILESRTRY